MKLAGANILITGAGRRVGAGLVRYLAGKGAHIFVHCHQSMAEAETLVDSLPGGVLRHRVICIDFNAEDAAAKIFNQCGGAVIDVLINNAAIYRRASLLEGTPEELEAHLAVNFKMPLALMRVFAAQDKLRHGVIVNMLDSEIGHEVPLDGAYALSKRLLRDATLAAARELAPRIRVNGLAPGPVLAPDALAHLNMRDTLPKIPMAQVPTLDELGDGCRFLIENNAVTGLILFVDGGYHLVGSEDKKRKQVV